MPLKHSGVVGQASMAVMMVSIREVWMGMLQQFVPVKMTMFAAGYHRIIMLMLMVFVMYVFMIVLHL